MADINKQVAVGVIEWLKSNIATQQVRSEDFEGLETATQIIEEAFSVTEADLSTHTLQPSSLKQLIQVYQKTKASSANAAPAASTSASTPNARDKAAAEDLKTKGNQLMASKDYQAAIDAYTSAIDKDSQNPVYWSNRAAAYSQMNKQEEAIADAKQAALVDPSFSKAYSRLGHALYCSGRYQESVEAYEKGLNLDPNNAAMKNSLATAKSKVASSSTQDAEEDEEAEDEVASRDAGSTGGAGGGFPGFGAGGMPDLAGLMSNPAIMNMAQQMMQNGGLEGLMNNPQLRQMAESFGAGRGGGMPDLASMMNNPAVRQFAESMGRGRGRGNQGNSNNNNNNNMYG